MPPDPRSDPKMHTRFLAYKERHVYFGRGVEREPLTLEEFAALDAERTRLLQLPETERTAEVGERLGEIVAKLHLD
ncbi:MAG: hypothetical protein NVSMB47_16600 [Polyangiales bacterium]